VTETTRKPWHLSGRDCAAALDIAPSTFSEREYVPALKDGRRKFYDIRHIIRAEAISGVHAISDGEVIDHDAEKARLTKARRIAQELDNAEREGKLRPRPCKKSVIFVMILMMLGGHDVGLYRRC